ncbi:MAG TPA: hypothetical protein VF783_26785, partial [Terriglobales bacterium]
AEYGVCTPVVTNLNVSMAVWSVTGKLLVAHNYDGPPRDTAYEAGPECYNFHAGIINCEAFPERLRLSGSGSAW